jgi:hypothetical protein
MRRITMRTKDSYQEHMLGDLVGVETEIEKLEQLSHIRRSDLIELYNKLDAALERLWLIISSNEIEWELLRFNLEASCDDLLRGYYRILLRSRKSNLHWT